ncbi:hypothetical protein B0H13DRAFT_2537338 [Mycena leptocephala]|nr:hypothetical protein B0H13DRAFT_2537338 [Mycena leptocephala]
MHVQQAPSVLPDLGVNGVGRRMRRQSCPFADGRPPLSAEPVLSAIPISTPPCAFALCPPPRPQIPMRSPPPPTALGLTGQKLKEGGQRTDPEGSAAAPAPYFMHPASPSPLRFVVQAAYPPDIWQCCCAALERDVWRPLTWALILIFIPLSCCTQFELIVRPCLDVPAAHSC